MADHSPAPGRLPAPWSGRAAAVFGVTLSFLVMLGSGAALFVAPQGRRAAEIGWTLAGLSRELWEAVHLATSVLFASFALWHLLVHVSVYRGLLFGSPARAGHRAETGLAVGAVILVLILAMFDLPPVSWLVELGGWFKRVYWAS
ncbi:DUF4405 domain-containing protein [Roseicyclus persicicus]|uniref:DUF4405 domain-containing protein n=1 Tax=Roseicyclus persicicus TaxID=2650661 RepID=A0A7X6H182_9RHOB|nr:DUF4405 domain-containing protein [Roseibacterium persicicum]NKX44947.1 DUF4405 domain-containing protein [Roseibacterium persicicum]